MGIGIISTISTSNTKKITASKKNRKENGIRAVFLGSNPHSYGEYLFRVGLGRDLNHQARAIKIAGRIIEIIIGSKFIL